MREQLLRRHGKEGRTREWSDEFEGDLKRVVQMAAAVEEGAPLGGAALGSNHSLSGGEEDRPRSEAGSDAASMVSALSDSEEQEKQENGRKGTVAAAQSRSGRSDYHGAEVSGERETRKLRTLLVTDMTCGPPPILFSSQPTLAIITDERASKRIKAEEREKVARVMAALHRLPLTESNHRNQKEEERKGNFWLKFLEGKKELEVTSLSLEEVVWCNELVVVRYLRSYQWNEELALSNIKKTLWWRRMRRPEDISPKDVSEQFERGKIYRKGFDWFGNPVVYFRLKNETTTDPREMVSCMIYTLERAMQSIPLTVGAERVTFVLDFDGWSPSQVPPMEVSSEVIHIMTDHYTSVLEAAFIVDAPSFFEPLWKVAKMIVHPETAAKVFFVSSSSPDDLAMIKEHIPVASLEKWVGGEDCHEYDHKTYWQQEEIQYIEFKMNRRRLVTLLEGTEQVKAWPRAAAETAPSSEGTLVREEAKETNAENST